MKLTWTWNYENNVQIHQLKVIGLDRTISYRHVERLYN